MMTLCDDGHDEVCYDGRNCPACELLAIISKKEDEIENLKDEVKDLEGRI